MTGQLTSNEIEHVLHSQIIGRIGCHDNDRVYVVPLSYAYDGKYIYCHSYEGRKLQIMRRHPDVCFQVDEMKDMGNWKSVVAWGRFEELTDKKEKNQALVALLKRALPFVTSITTHLGASWPFLPEDDNGYDEIPGVVFRILAEEKSGRFEKTTEVPANLTA